MKTDPCLYFFKYSPDVLKKKTIVLDIFNTNKKCFVKNNIESSPPELWIRIRFLEINRSPSLVKIKMKKELKRRRCKEDEGEGGVCLHTWKKKTRIYSFKITFITNYKFPTLVGSYWN